MNPDISPKDCRPKCYQPFPNTICEESKKSYFYLLNGRVLLKAFREVPRCLPLEGVGARVVGAAAAVQRQLRERVRTVLLQRRRADVRH